MRTLPLGVRIVALVIPLALLPIAFVGGVAYYYLEDSVRAEAQNRELQTLDEAVALVGAALDQASRVAETIGSMLAGQGVDSADHARQMGGGALQQSVRLSLGLSPSVRMIAVVSRTGGPVVLGAQAGADAGSLADGLGAFDDLSEPSRVAIHTNGRPRLFAAYPVKGTGRVCMVVEIDRDWLRRSLADMTRAEGGSFFLTDQRGRVLVSSPAPDVGAPAGLDAALASQPPAGPSVVHLADARPEMIHYAAPAARLAGGRGADAAPIYLIRESPRGALIDQIAELRSTATLLAGAALALGLMGAGLIARTVVHRLNALLGMTSRIAAGHFDVRLPKGRDDEIGQLVEAFNTMAGSLGTFRDRLVHAESFAAIGRVASTLAHEVRNPLNAMRGCVDYLRLKRPDDEVVTHHAGIIADEIAELDEFVRDFLRVARVERPVFVVVDLHALIEARLTLHAAAAAGAGVRVVKRLDAERPVIQADGHQIAMVLENLINNALEAMPAGGTLLVRTWDSDTGLAVSVQDTGPGIPPEVAGRISTPFFTTKPGGTGLGLAISRRVVEAHGGQFSFGPRSPSPGAVFTVELPLAQPSTATR